jgi:16S rRNA (guanine527-N7)-methyltransferase
MNREIFIDELFKIGINITEYQLQQLDKYYEKLIEWNNKINLTTIIEKKDVYLKHFYDSLTLSLVYDLTQPISICDVGTGAGFPGLVLKIVFPQLKVTLLDSLQKRLTFLETVIKELNLRK